MRTKNFTQFLLIVFLSSLGGVMAQNKTERVVKEDVNKDQKKETAVYIDGRKLTGDELEKELQKVRQQQELVFKEQMQEDRIELQKEAMNTYRRSLQELNEKGADDYYVLPRPERWTNQNFGVLSDNFNIWSVKQNNSLIISKDLSEVTNATDFTYEVKEDNFTIRFAVNGTLSAGELKISLKKPDGKAFQDITISPLADIDWNQEFNWDEEDQEEYLGKWIISIKATNAKGKYNVRVSSR